MEISVTNCDGCILCNVSISNVDNGDYTGKVRLNCRLQKDVIRSVAPDEWEKMFERCPLKKEGVSVTLITAPNVERSVATDDKSEPTQAG